MAVFPGPPSSKMDEFLRALDQRVISIVQKMIGRSSPTVLDITFNIDGGGAVLVPGVQLWTQIDFGFQVTGVTVSTTSSDATTLAAIKAGGAAAFDVFQALPFDPLGQTPDWTTQGQNALTSMIGAGTDVPTLSASLYQALPVQADPFNTALLQWDVPVFTAGNILAVSVQSLPVPAVITQANLCLRVRKQSG